MGVRILVVENDADFRRKLCQTLNEKDIQTDEAQDGVVAVQKLRAGSYSLVISDLMMPRSTGIDLLRWVLEQKLSVPIILMTGFTGLYDVPQALKLGAAGFLPKPFERKNLFNLIESALSGKKSDNPICLDDDFCKVSIDDFITGSTINVAIYVRLSPTKYVMIAHEGENINPHQIQNYKKKDIHYLYLTKQDFKRYVGFGSLLTKGVAKSSSIEYQRKVNFLRYTSEILLQNLYINKIDDENMDYAKNIVEASVSVLSDDTDGFRLIESFSEHSNFEFCHSVGVSFYSTLIGRKLKWLSPRTLFKLAMAGLLHDIGKKEISGQILNKSRQDLNTQEVAILETHPIRGMEILGVLMLHITSLK